MSPSRHDQIGTHFLEARELTGEARRQYLDELAARDPELSNEVESLLTADENEFTVLDESDNEERVGGIRNRKQDHLIGRRLGRYVVQSVIASGGMGTVYKATQEKPRRTVAVKVVKPGWGSTSALRRFEIEAQILGQLQHPGIAQVFEAHVYESDAGRVPYFVMEYIPNALTITEFARRKNLGVRGRLALFANVCDAIYHGHQKGIVHRDVKPGNVLVDESGQPKIIDFGVARATDLDIQVTTMRTDAGQLIGTLAYMSPEQVAGDSRAIDTRSDVYSLGVLLYELLVGKLPQDLQQRSIVEAARIIQESDPPALSTVNTVFRGDVDTIVTKALEKEKARRYQSAAELAADIRRYLGNQPISARPASTMYQLQKFARRNVGLVVAGAVALVFLVAGLVATSWYAYQASIDRDAALEANRRMRIESAKAAAINDFLIEDLLTAADPRLGVGHELTIVEALEASTPRIGDAFAEQPEVASTLHLTIGNLAMRLGRVQLAEHEFREAINALASMPSPSEIDIARIRERLAFALRTQGRLDESVELFEELVAFWRPRAGEYPIDLADVLHGLASAIYRRGGEGAAAKTESIEREALAIYEEKYDPEHESILSALGALANALYSQDKVTEAVELAERVHTIQLRKWGRSHYNIARDAYDLAVMNMKIEDYSRAEELLNESVATMRRLAGDANPIVAKAIGQHGRLHAKQGEYERALLHYLEALQIQRAHLDPHHNDLRWTLIYLARARESLGRYAEAEPNRAEAYTIYQANYGEESFEAARGLLDWARNLVLQEKYGQAEPMLRESLDLHRRTLDKKSHLIEDCRAHLGTCLLRLGKLDEAEPELLGAYDSVSTSPDPNRTILKRCLDSLIELYQEREQEAEAAKWNAKRDAAFPLPSSGAAG